MGSGSYHEDVREAQRAIGTTRTSASAFAHSTRASTGQADGCHPDLNPKGKTRESCDSREHPDSTPIAVMMDVTSSRGDDAKVIYEGVPSFLGALKVSNVVPSPQILWGAIGDANSDRAPLQVSQFESDRRIDGELGKIWMEKGGGGTGEESYELGAYFLARKTKLDATSRGKKGFAFFLGDEAPYPVAARQLVQAVFGDKINADIPSRVIFGELQQKFHTFLIYPGSSMESRRAAIDTEIQRRLEAAGGRFREVDIRASLIWHTRDDLDLHCRTPAGEHIFYGFKCATCKGELDVDQNVRGENPKPVENIRWAKGDARRGRYTFWVELYGHHERPTKDIEFAVELDINGEIERHDGVIPVNATRQQFGSITVDFAPGKGKASKEPDAFAAYTEGVVIPKWEGVIPSEQILRIASPASAVECMLGAMALKSGKFDLDTFVRNMKERNVREATRDDVRSALTEFARRGCAQEVGGSAFA